MERLPSSNSSISNSSNTNKTKYPARKKEKNLPSISFALFLLAKSLQLTFCSPAVARSFPMTIATTTTYPWSEGDKLLSEVDYRSQGGPKISYVPCHTNLPKENPDDHHSLHGLSFQGAVLGCDERIYSIPGDSDCILVLDTKRQDCISFLQLMVRSNDIDHENEGIPMLLQRRKWRGGVSCGEFIYGLPCLADTVLKIDVKSNKPSQKVTLLDISDTSQEPSSISQNDNSSNHDATKQPTPCVNEQDQPLVPLYNGGSVSSVNGHIYCVPYSARHVLRIDPSSDACTRLALPKMQCNQHNVLWSGGQASTADGSVYGIPHDATQVLRIQPHAEEGEEETISLHGQDLRGPWQATATSLDGTIVCFPVAEKKNNNNVPMVLCIQPDQTRPHLFQLPIPHQRDNALYDYRGAATGTDGKVYAWGRGESVLQVDVAAQTVTHLPILPLSSLRADGQNDECWQEGLTLKHKQVILAFSSHSILQIECQGATQVTRWPLPSAPPGRNAHSWNGATLSPDGILYAMPFQQSADNPALLLRVEGQHSTVEPYIRCKPQTEDEMAQFIYRSGIPTLRSSAHRVKFAPHKRKHNPNPKNLHGQPTGTTWLPDALCSEAVFDYESRYLDDLRQALIRLLQACEPSIVGEFGNPDCPVLEEFRVAQPSTWRKVNGGQCESAQKYLSDAILDNTGFLQAFDRLVTEAILPYLKNRLQASVAIASEIGDENSNSYHKLTFYYQRPPTLRLQPGPAWSQVKAHDDAQYGHQNGELNFWLPLTDRYKTGVDLFCESRPGQEDYHAVVALPGQAIAFHGSSRKHFVNNNASPWTRVSMDFRIGVEGYFDPFWQMKGTTDDHGRQEIRI